MKAVLVILLAIIGLIQAGFPPLSKDLLKIISSKNITASPSQVHVSYAGKNQFLIQWVSTSTSDPSVVNYGTSPNSLTNTASGSAVSYSFEGYTSGGIHSVLLPALNSGTTYYYRVGGTGQWSDTFNFKSAPAPRSGNLVFAVTGDVGAGPNSELTIKGFLKVRETMGLDLVLHAGDLSYANNYNPGGPVWDHYGEIMQPLIAYTPYNPSVGNHESLDAFTGYKLRYGLSILEKNSNGGDFYWSFDWGDVHIVMLSSENDYSVTSPQRAWLEKDLAAVDRTITPWIFAIWHRPWYCSDKNNASDGQKMRVSIEPVLNKYKVDIAITGHVHAYERIAEMYDFVPTPGKTSYFMAGNGGTPEGMSNDWATPQPAWSLFRQSKWGYGVMNVVNSTHAHWTMYADIDGSLMDQAWVVKSYPR